MQGNLHVRFGVGVGVKLPGLHHRKTLTPEQKSQAADTFGAEGEFLSAGKKLLDTRHPAFKAVTAVRGRMLSFWKGITLPYPEPGIRLIRQERHRQLRCADDDAQGRTGRSGRAA